MPGEPIEYNTGEVIKIYKGEELLKVVDREEFEDMTNVLLEKIPEGKF